MLRQNLARKAKTKSITAPVGGLNARDAYADMPAGDAAVLENFWPMPTYIMPRLGNLIWASGLPGAVTTLACYSPPNGARKLFAASSGSIYDVTSKAVVGAPSVTGQTNDWWQSTNFGAGGGQYLVMVNGQDPMLVYNGSGWEKVGNGTGAVISSASAVGTTATINTVTPHGLSTGQTVTVIGATPAAYNVANAVITVTGASSFTYVAATPPGGVMTVIGTYTYAPAITGVSPSTFINVNSYQGRLFFMVKNSAQVWYLGLGAIGGAANVLDFSTQLTLGGSIIAMATWSIQTDNGSTENACFLSSEGEILVYQGNDPALASNWSKIGSFRIGRPVGYRCFAKIGSDIAVLCADGLIPLSKAALTDRETRAIAVSDKIVNLINVDVHTYAGLNGWQVILFPIGNKVVINVPASPVPYQYVMNTLNSSWTKFTGWSANCWALVGDSLYYGDNGLVYQADTGQSDSGVAIKCNCVQAPNYFGTDEQKLFSLGRPIITSNGPVSMAFQVNTDIDLRIPTELSNYNTAQATYWGAPWLSPWTSISQVYKTWIPVGNLGYIGSVAISMLINSATVNWQSTDIAYSVGGPI